MSSNSLERDASQLTRNIDRISEASLDLPRLLQRAELAGRMGAGQETVDSIDGKRSLNINRKAGWQNRSENSAIGEFSRFRFRADKLTTPLFALWRVIAWRRRTVTRVDIALVIVRTVLVLVIMVVVHLKTASIIGMMGTHGGGIGVMVMQATSKHNVRTKCDERQAMNGASKHGVNSPKVRAVDCSQFAGPSQSQSISALLEAVARKCCGLPLQCMLRANWPERMRRSELRSEHTHVNSNSRGEFCFIYEKLSGEAAKLDDRSTPPVRYPFDHTTVIRLKALRRQICQKR